MTITRRTVLAGAAAGLLLPDAWLPTARADGLKSRVIDIRIEKRKVVAPKGTIRVTEGDTIVLRFSSDETVNLHLHGYDKEIAVAPGDPGMLTLTVHATGRFPITSHGHGHHALTYLEVRPR